ncbi:MAG TPA: hypothetical protein VFU30_11125 [Gaiellaceae bacterium]|nr:hypothetical protein [Gaiellaceae bacterium]
MSETSFDRVISEHLALCERNKRLEGRMPLDHYRTPTKDEAEAETEAPAKTEEEQWLDSDSAWDTTLERPLPEFDWGDE